MENSVNPVEEKAPKFAALGSGNLPSEERTPSLWSRLGRVGMQLNVGNRERIFSAGVGSFFLYRAFQTPRLRNLMVAGLGAALVQRAVTGSCALYKTLGISTREHDDTRPARDGIHVCESVTINRPPDEVYSYWRHLENLPLFMQHLEEVTVLSPTRSRWKAKAPAGFTVEWEAEITEDKVPHHLSWESLPGAAVPNSGAVGFVPGLGGKVTEVKVSLRYEPPAGKLGMIIAKIFGEEPGQQIAEDLQCLKEKIEGGKHSTVVFAQSDKNLLDPL